MIPDGFTNLLLMYEQADAIDRREGAKAYWRYNDLMKQIAERYGWHLDKVIAGFVALSPNSDYVGNVRSLLSVLEGISQGVNLDQITTATYKHCRDRAYSYLVGNADFWTTTKGKKIRSFYMNILNPDHPFFVTVDGHISAAWQGRELTMKEAIVKPKQYDEIANDLFRLSRLVDRIPNQVQASIWFARKRTRNIKFNRQMDVFLHQSDDNWNTMVNLDELKPYPLSIGAE